MPNTKEETTQESSKLHFKVPTTTEGKTPLKYKLLKQRCDSLSKQDLVILLHGLIRTSDHVCLFEYLDMLDQAITRMK